MKILLKRILPLIISISITGSSCSSVPYTESIETTTVTGAAGGEQPAAAVSAQMPALYIEAANGSSDFATMPVSGHVSEQIASWTPGYVMPPEPYYETCTVSMKDGDGVSILAPAEAQVKARGNWTTTYDKRRFA